MFDKMVFDPSLSLNKKWKKFLLNHLARLSVMNVTVTSIEKKLIACFPSYDTSNHTFGYHICISQLCLLKNKVKTPFAMAETIPQGASLSREITKNSQVPINSEHIDLQSVGFNQGESSNSPETEPKDQKEVSYFRISSTLIPMLIVEIVLSFADLLSDTWTGLSLLKLKDKLWGGISLAINWIPGAIGAI